MRMIAGPPIIFVHVPKTGGTSVANFLDENLPNAERIRMRGPASLHSPLQQIERAMHEDLHNFDVIGVKRNTWDRLVSYFMMSSKFPRIPALRDKKTVLFEDYYTAISRSMEHVGDYFYFFEVGGGIPDNVTFLDFDNLHDDVHNFWNNRGFEIISEFPHLNMSTNVEDYIRKSYLRDQKFIDVIAKKYRREIDYFGFEPPPVE